jgi:hypothetical protein
MALAMPLESHLSLGKGVGGVSEGPTRSSPVWSDPCRSCFPRRDGGRRPGLRDGVVLRGSARERRSWSVRLLAAGLLPCRRSHRRHRTSRGRRRRERCPHARIATHAPDARCSNHLTLRLSTRPSLGPRTRAGQSPRVNPCGATRSEVARSSRYRGRECLVKARRNPAPGPSRVDLARLAASHRSRKGVRVRHQNRKGVMALVPARITRARGSCPHVVCSCRSRQATPGLKEARQTRLKKGGRGVVNGDLDPRGPRRSHVEDSRTVEAANRPPRSASDITERPREKAQGDVRASSSGCRARRKAGAKVAGPGL